LVNLDAVDRRRDAGHLRVGEERPDVGLEHLVAEAEPVEAVGDDRRIEALEALDQSQVPGHATSSRILPRRPLGSARAVNASSNSPSPKRCVTSRPGRNRPAFSSATTRAQTADVDPKLAARVRSLLTRRSPGSSSVEPAGGRPRWRIVPPRRTAPIAATSAAV